jgi:acetolactate synthase-1/3 small subunit
MDIGTPKQNFTIILYTEHTFGMLNKVSCVFSRRRINLESITLSGTREKDVVRMTVVVQLEEKEKNKLEGQLNKLIGVLKVFSYKKEEILCREVALYKIAIPETEIHNLLQLSLRYQTRLLHTSSEYIVLEQTDTEERILALYEQLQQYHILDFAKSGQVAAILRKQASQHIYPYKAEQTINTHQLNS